MNDVNLGQLIRSKQSRDAIHIAVAPVTASQNLKPGQEIVFVDSDNERVKAAITGESIGIVDPFLKFGPRKGNRFWMFLHPNTITSLRHDWTHPAFENAERSQQNMSDAEAWLRRFADEDCDGLEYTELLDAAERYIEHGEYLNHGSRFEGVYVPDEFWDYFEAVKQKKVSERDRGSFFTCSC